MKPTLLIAEDSNLHEMLRLQFEDGFEITHAYDEFQGTSCLRNASAPFDVCLFDIIMPALPGSSSVDGQASAESEDLDREEETGLRLVKLALDLCVCKSLVILSVRWDVEDRVVGLVRGRVPFRFVLKQQGQSESLAEAVSAVLSRVD